MERNGPISGPVRHFGLVGGLAAAAGFAALALLAGAGNAAQPDWSKTAYSARANYVLRCSGCHGLDGHQREKGGIPALKDSVGVFTSDPDGRTYLLKVPGVRNSNLSPADTAAVLNYVMTTFAGESLPADAPAFTADEVEAAAKVTITDVVGLRREVSARLRAQGMKVADYPWP